MAPCAVAAAPAFSGGASRSSRRSPGLAGDSRIVGSLAPPVEGRHFYQGREADTVPLILNGAFNFRAGGHQPSRRNICFLVIFAVCWVTMSLQAQSSAVLPWSDRLKPGGTRQVRAGPGGSSGTAAQAPFQPTLSILFLTKVMVQVCAVKMARSGDNRR